MIRFTPIKLSDKSWVDEIVMSENSPSADYNFGNIYIWDKHFKQLTARCGDRMLTKLRYDGKPTFVFPIGSGELVKLCEQELQWKKSTTYTVLKKLCEHGIFQNENGTVTSLLSQEGYNAVQSEKFVEDTFDGSLPAFLAAFTTRKSLSEKDIAEIQRMIDRCGKE